MLYLALGSALVVIFLWSARAVRLRPQPREWRLGAGALAIAAFTAAAFVGLRGEWGRAIILISLGLWLASLARLASPRTVSQPQMNLVEARSVLGVEPGASRAQIQAAYSRLMRRAHPDVGGTHGLAAQLNRARDILLSQSKTNRD